MQLAIFSNTGSWDPQCIGFIGTIDVARVDELEDAIDAFISNDLPEVTRTPIHFITDEDDFSDLVDEHELSTYYDCLNPMAVCAVVQTHEVTTPCIYVVIPL